MYPDSSRGLNKETAKAIYFFTPAFAPLDTFSAHAVKIWGKVFLTAEHAFQWKKFSVARKAVAAKILKAPSSHLANVIAHQNKKWQPADWHKHKVAIMEQILRAKVRQHEDVRMILKKTGRRTIVENNPVNSFWGIGPTGKGENMMGKLWMKIRNDIK